MSKQYSIEGHDFSRSTKATVIAKAQEIAAATKQAVNVLSPAGNVVFSLPAVGRKAYAHPKPDTRALGDFPASLQKFVDAGWTPAYDRKSRDGFVLRNDDAGEGEKFLVTTGKGKKVGYAPTTRGAGVLLKTLPKVNAA